MTFFCPNCGKQLTESSKFCASCGRPVVHQIPAQPQQQYADRYAPTPQQQYIANPQYQNRQPYYQAPSQPVTVKKNPYKTALVIVSAGLIVVALAVVAIITNMFGLLGREDVYNGNGSEEIRSRETPGAENTQPEEGADNGEQEDLPVVTESGRFGRLTASIMEIFDNGTFHIVVSALNTDATGRESEQYFKDGMSAILVEFEGEVTRIVTRDGKEYMIRDLSRTVFVSDVPVKDDDFSPFNASGLTYVREGTEEFNGGVYEFDEYADSAGVKLYYYMDSGSFIGMRVIDISESIDLKVIVFDSNVPDDIFDIPADYHLIG